MSLMPLFDIAEQSERKEGFRTVFFDPRLIWLVPNDLAKFQLQKHLLAHLDEDELCPVILSFGNLENALIEELAPPEIDSLSRMFILENLAEDLAAEFGLNRESAALMSELAGSLGDGFDRLKLAGLPWERIEQLPGGKTGSLVAALGRRYDNALNHLGLSDRFTRRRQLLESLKTGHPFKALAGLEKVTCVKAQRLSPFETDLLAALAQAVPLRLELEVPAWVLEEDIKHGAGFNLLRSIRFFEKMEDSSLELSFKERVHDSPALLYASETLLAPISRRLPVPPDPAGRIGIVEAPTAFHEVEEAARQLKELVKNGHDPNGLALVAPDLNVYGPFIDDLGRQLGLAFHFRRGFSLIERGPVKAVLALLALWDSNWERPRLADLIKSPYFDFSLNYSPSELARLALDSGVTDARAGGGLEDNLTKILAREKPDAENRPQSSRAALMAASLLKLSETLREAQKSLEKAKSWPVFIKTFKKILNNFKWPGNLSRAPESPLNLKADDLAAAYAFKEELDRLAAALAGPSAPAVGLAAFRHWLKTVLSECHLSYDRNPEGRIQVLNYYDLHGGEFEEIFFLGLNERLFPDTGPETSWWPREFTRAAAEILGRPLWTEAADRYREEEMILAMGLGQASRRVRLFYHAADNSGREVLPSPLLESLKDLWPISGPEVCKTPWTRDLNLSEAANEQEKWRVLIKLRPDLWPDQSLRTPENETFWQKLNKRRADWARMASVSTLDNSSLQHWLERRPSFNGRPLLRPAALASFHDCPFSFCLSEIFGLKVDGEELESWSAASEGTLIHNVLERFFQPLAENGTIWPGRENPAECQARLLGILTGELEQLAKGSPLGRLPLWNIRRQRLPKILSAWLEREMREAEEDVRPLKLEWAFKDWNEVPQAERNGSPPWELPLSEDDSLFFQGRIDRIDDQGESLIVRDYKLRDRPDFIINPKKPEKLTSAAWPILVYSLAATAAFQKPAAGYFEIIAPYSRFARRGAIFSGRPEMDSGLARRREMASADQFNFPNLLAATWQKLMEGVFRPKEDRDQACSWCPHSIICPLFNTTEGEA